MYVAQTPKSLEELRKICGPEDRICAAKAYIELLEKTIEEAREIRDAAISSLEKEYGAAEAARRSGMSLATVKTIRRYWR